MTPYLMLNNQLIDQLISSLCNTLVHSLWQGLLLAVVTGSIIVLTKKTSPAMRYNLLISALLLFTLGTVTTFVAEFKLTQNIESLQLIHNSQPAMNIQNTQPIIQPVNISTYTTMVFNYLNAHRNTVVLVWFLIICIKTVQLISGLYGIHQLKKVKTLAAGKHWEDRMKHLASQLGITQTIGLLQSGIAKVPMAVGHLKPVVLVPIGLLSALSASEVEAILVHELAHIRRRDYLVNLLQSLLEIVFFFNPAVWWVSQLIKTERENCCDDMALEQTGSKVSYIRALVSCQEYQSAATYAMTFAGNKNTLVERAKRMISNRNHSLNLFEKTFLSACLVITGLCMSAFAEKESIKRVVHHVVNSWQRIATNDIVKPKLTGHTLILQQQEADKLNQATVRLVQNPPQTPVLDSAKVSTPFVANQPTDNLGKLNIALGHLNAPLGHLTGILDTNKNIKVKIDSIKVKAKVNTIVKVSVYDAYSSAYGNSASSYSSSSSAGSSANTASGGYSSSYAYSDTVTRPAAPRVPSVPRPATLPRRPNVPRVAAPSMPAAPAAPSAYANSAYVPAAAYTPAGRSAQAHRDSIALKNIVTEMTKDGLISDDKNLHFVLSNKAFIVNGKQQDDTIFEKYKQKYMPASAKTGWDWVWSYTNKE